ncbi:MarR family transcriptional regulator [Sutcliffiella rhizosphaerae]|uniref:HTH-type transcriptional regulator YusO n=1 Tax=Sutcliffiella rhizosphaerae TaxID=2880967 RepID=A0ABN8AEQ4_9BACI|nr:MarR family transcriptional regulator [Sutcliffiella rhizosphaerae]CAG9623750.1 putative HTH-type transcriptional regulator YusO [Sutcliffiella rhizosphaerae]
MKQEDLIKEAFHIFEEINNHLAINYYSMLEIELSPKQFMVLQIINENHPVKVHEISKQLGLSMSSVSQIVNRLEKDYYVSRDINPENRREILLSLGPSGDKFFKEYERVDRLVIDNYFSKLTIEETRLFRDIAKKIYNVITSGSKSND